MKRLGILGAGHLSAIVVEAYNRGLLEGYEIVGIMGRDMNHVKELAAKCVANEDNQGISQVKVCDNIAELLACKPDIITEAASVQAVKDNAEEILTHGASFVVLSIGAFADQAYCEKIEDVAKENGQKLYLTSGAVGGFDVLRTLSLMDEDMKVEFCTHKGPKSLQNTTLYSHELMTDEEESKVFQGNAQEAINILPTKVNVAVASSLASAGPEKTEVSIYSVPGMIGDDHCITAEAAGCKTIIDTYSPTAEIAGWSVVALLRNLESGIVVF